MAGIVAGLVLAGSAPAAAAGLALRPDPAASRVTFALGATLHTVHGTIPVRSAEFHIDTEAGTIAGEIVLDARAAATGNSSRDAKMHRDVLQTGRFPEIAFVARRVTGRFDPAGTSTLVVSGTIRILGAEHPVSVPVRVTATGGRLVAEAQFTVPYVEWGVPDPSSFLLRVDKTVEIEVRLVAPPPA